MKHGQGSRKNAKTEMEFESAFYKATSVVLPEQPGAIVGFKVIVTFSLQ